MLNAVPSCMVIFTAKTILYEFSLGRKHVQDVLGDYICEMIRFTGLGR